MSTRKKVNLAAFAAKRIEDLAQEIYVRWSKNHPHAATWEKTTDNIKNDCREIAKWHLEHAK